MMGSSGDGQEGSLVGQNLGKVGGTDRPWNQEDLSRASGALRGRSALPAFHGTLVQGEEEQPLGGTQQQTPWFSAWSQEEDRVGYGTTGQCKKWGQSLRTFGVSNNLFCSLLIFENVSGCYHGDNPKWPDFCHFRWAESCQDCEENGSNFPWKRSPLELVKI